MNKSYMNIASRVFNRPLLLEPGYARVFMSALAPRLNIDSLKDASGDIDMEAEVKRAMASDGISSRGQADTKHYKIVDGIAVIPVAGTLVHKLGRLHPYSGMTGYDGIVELHKMACADSQVKGVLLDMDSPGGEVAGCFDAARKLREQAEDSSVPLWASCYDLNASAAMALASAASRRLITQTGLAGSVGVVMGHTSYEKYLENEGIKVTLIHSGANKVDGNPYEDLSPEVLSEFQESSHGLRQDFAELVSSHLSMSVDEVLSTEAKTYRGQEAVDIGFADEVINGNDALTVFSQFLSSSGSSILNPGGSTMDENTEKKTGDQSASAETEAKAKATAALAEATATATTSERARIKSIMECEEATGRSGLAEHIAFDTSMTLEEAKKMLASSAMEEQNSESTSLLDAAMSNEKQPEVGASAGSSDLSDTDKQVASIMGSYQAATGRKPAAVS